MQTRTWRTRGIAWVLVLGWHVLVGWWLLHALPTMHHAEDDYSLRVVEVIVRLPSPPPALQLRVLPTTRYPASDTTPLPEQRAPTPTDDAKPAGVRSPSLVEQAGSMIRRNMAANSFANDPLADRLAPFPPRTTAASGCALRRRPPARWRRLEST